MALTANDFAQQMIGQARILDPSFSGEIGTPERKIIDTVAQTLADNQIDLTGLQGAFDIDSKVGTNLDQFTAMFAFQRQQSQVASGFVVYSRNTPAPATIVISRGATIQANAITSPNASGLQFTTTSTGTIVQGATESNAIPVQAISPGTIGNTDANSLTQMVGTPVPGVTSVTNPVAITNGQDGEDDNSFKTRFKNTWARNLAGTTDQYLALAVAGAFTAKANVIGQQSRYREYIQVPDRDDIGGLNGIIDPFNNTFGTPTSPAVPGEWTSALSDIPYAKEIYDTTPAFVSNGQSGVTSFYFRPDNDFEFNAVPKIAGDALRDSQVTTAPFTTTPTVGSQSLPASTLNVISTAAFPVAGVLYLWNPTFTTIIAYTGITAGSFTGCSGGTGTVGPETIIFLIQTLPAAGGVLFTETTVGFPTSGTLVCGVGSDATPQLVTYSGKTDTTFTGCLGGSGQMQLPSMWLEPVLLTPNYTFLNVFNPSTPTDIVGLQTVKPGDVVLSEYSYVSTASRNSLARNINNAVDIYVDGTNDVQASTVFLPNAIGTNFQFVNDPTSPWYYENFRRVGQPAKRPQVGSYLTQLFQSPVDSLPSQLVINNQTFYEGVHYWLVQEIGPLAGSIRARDGIEWNHIVGALTAVPPTDPLAPFVPDGTDNIATVSAAHQAIEVTNYLYDSNIITLQASAEAAKQITTDPLVHQAQLRYFKLDITVMYSPNNNPAVVNAAIGAAVQAFFDRQYFGTVVQLSDLLETIHLVPGVDNVRWSNDLPIVPNSIRVLECDVAGNPLHGATVDRLHPGAVAAGVETQTLYIVGEPGGATQSIADLFAFQWIDASTTHGGTIPNALSQILTPAIPFWDISTGAAITAATIQTAINSAIATAGATGMYGNIVVSQDARSTVNTKQPILSFTLTYGGNGTPVLPTVQQVITRSDYAFDSDFFLLDDELPSLPLGQVADDTVPGLIIRTRAQNTWLRNNKFGPVLSPPGSGGTTFAGTDSFGGDGTFGGGGTYGS